MPFLNDLVAGFPEGSFAAVITPTLSLFFQEWFKISPTPTIIGTEWRQYLGAVSLLVQVKPIAALVCQVALDNADSAVPVVTGVGCSRGCGAQDRVAVLVRPSHSSKCFPSRIRMYRH